MRNGHFRMGRSQTGFSVLEVMMAMMVLTSGMLGLTMMLNTAAHQDGNGRRKDRATMIAYDLLHHLEQIPFDSTALVDTYSANDTDLLNLANALAGSWATALPSDTFDHDDTVLCDPDVSGSTTCSADDNFLGYVPAGTFTAGTGFRPSLDFNNDGVDDFMRNWIIVDDPIRGIEPASPGKRIAVVVSWRSSSFGVRRWISVVGYRANHQLLLPPRI